MTFIDHGNVPSSTAIRVWLGELLAHGFTSVRTGAVTDVGADTLQRQGFETLQTLRLLDVSLVGWRPPVGNTTHSRRLKVLERGEAARVDRAAFGEQWAIDVDGIDETCTATPSHRARTIHSDDLARPLAGYAISGRAERTGYLQRLAVHPEQQGRGVGFSLACDSLVWMQRRRLTRAVVNTHTDNDVALGLYRRMGFRVLPQGLAVMSRSLRDL